MATETIFPDGVNVFLPHEKAPDFVICDISLEPRKFVAFLKAHEQYKSEKGYFKFTLKKGKNENYYLALDTYRPEMKKEVSEAQESYGDVPF